MSVADPTCLSVRALRTGIAEGRWSRREVVAAFVSRMNASPQLAAWAHTDDRAALAVAAAQDATADGRPLSGLLFGIKDVIAAKGFRTELGCPEYDGDRPGPDSDIAAAIRSAGGIVLGKTATCAFAGADPAATLNPLDPQRTPGGSSAGSAAAVAAGHVPIAVGSQTAGSVLRPASFCGVVGYKPTFGAVSTRGLFPFAESLDTIGFMARRADDVAYLLPHLAPEVSVPPDTSAPPVFVRMKVDWPISWLTDRHLDETLTRISDAGAEVIERDCPVDFAEIVELHGIVCLAEGLRVHADSMRRMPTAYGPQLTRYLSARVSSQDRDAAIEAQGAARKQFDVATTDQEVWVLPTVNGAAPPRSTTGDSSLQRLATFTGVPAISVPTYPSMGRLPFGTQLIAKGGNDAQLLAAAAWMQQTTSVRLED